MDAAGSELVFVALGGLGEIGMNVALYGLGPKRQRKWLMVDCGLAFADAEKAGIEIILPDLAFVDKIKRDLVGLIITHAHEDHIGAVAELWPRFRCPVFATPFATALLAARLEGISNAPEIAISPVKQGERIKLDPFDVEFIPVAHSIPESCALAIRTPQGLILHTGDWKIDPEPGLGLPTDAARLTEIGNEGVLALVCDSTNILRDGISPSEAEVALALNEVIGAAGGRVVVTTFASNVARIRAVALAARAAGRKVVLLGRAMERVVNVARENGYLEGIEPFLSGEAYASLGRDEIVVLATGSQGEPRAAMARIAIDDHPIAKLAPGDTVIFSSRTIPGNEREVGRIVNNLVGQGIEVITDRTALVHASGHPRRGEVAKFYEWVRPKIVVPAHGEELHLAEHAIFAAECGIATVVKARNGDMVVLAPGEPAIIDEVPHGQIARDGSILVPLEAESIKARQRLAFGGVVAIALAIDRKGEMAGVPDVVLTGLPERTEAGVPLDEVIDAALFQTFDSLPRPKRRDANVVSVAIEKAVRAAVGVVWNKKPTVHVLVIEV
ncbi:ribonuclease J [uncultured Methylovirgula sp.]|uniref:ribonuclease J n=1 Tax=uncultured Methylovirgula sp. TaxID=1285960 RepID=UPI002605BB78|nr:ribonuclease J [uncultured Methylovirgula sp.]